MSRGVWMGLATPAIVGGDQIWMLGQFWLKLQIRDTFKFHPFPISGLSPKWPSFPVPNPRTIFRASLTPFSAWIGIGIWSPPPECACPKTNPPVVGRMAWGASQALSGWGVGGALGVR